MRLFISETATAAFAAPILLMTLAGCGTPSPLVKAVDQRDVLLVDQMLRRGANVNEVSWSAPGVTTTALRRAVDDGNVEMVRELLHRGADADSGGEWSPLSGAVGATSPKQTIVKMLLDGGARVDDDVLHRVTRGYGDPAIAAMIIEACARQASQATLAKAPAHAQAPPEASSKPEAGPAEKPWWDKADPK